MAALPPTWAERASSATPESSLPPAPPARDLASSPSPTPSSSKASTSENWRAGSSSRAVVAADGWTAVKEERKRPSNMSSGPRENGGTRGAHHASSKGSNKANKSTPSSTTSATATSWATADPRDDSLPSPTFAPVPETSSVRDSFSLKDPATEQQTSTADSPPPAKAPSPAPLPTVNPWTVRKAQLAAAVASVAPAAPRAQLPVHQSSKEERPPKESTSKATKRSNTAKAAAAAALAAAASSSSSAPVKTPTPPTVPSPASTLPPAQQDPVPAATVKIPVAVPVQRKSEGWSAIKEVPASVTVAGGDLENWPAPNEESAVGKGKASKGRTAAAVVEQSADEPKKKADKTKWIQIKTDIRVAGAPSNRAPSTTGEKRAKVPRRDGAATDGTREVNGVAAKKSTASTSGAGSTAPATSQADKRMASSSRPATTPKAASDTRKVTSAPASRPDFPLPQRPTTLHPVTKSASSTPKNVVPTPIDAITPSSTFPVAPTATPTTNGIAALSNGPPAASTLPQSNGLPVDNSMQANAGNAFRGAATRGARGGPVRGGGRGGMPRKPFTGRPNLASAGIMPFHEHDSTTLSAASYPYSPEPPFYPNQPVLNGNQPYRALDPYTLDPTRYWLLGQLEWYMSVSNLVRDLYLRTKMDEQGWIDISVIASFNRIKALTTDEALVRDTMTLTPILEVFGQFVRLRQSWPEWVLPNAIPSRVDANDAAAASPAVPAEQRTDVADGSVGTSLVGAEEGNTSRGMSSEDEEEGTAATTASTGSEAEVLNNKAVEIVAPKVEVAATPIIA